MSEATTTGRFRSPPFPSIPLQRAIERVEQLYRQERDHAVPLSSAARAWSMSPTSSGPIVTAGALRQYGLIEYEGSGDAKKIRLTHDALRIALDKTPTSPSRIEALRKAFLSPKIFADIWAKWRADLPSDQTMINYLVLERRLANLAPYSDQSATELLANYRVSMPFAMSGDVPSPSPTGEEAESDAATEGENSLPAPPSSPPIRQSAQDIDVQRPAMSPAHSPRHTGGVRLMEGERIVFTEEGRPGQYLKLIASDDFDDTMLEALEDFVKRQRRRLQRSQKEAAYAAGGAELEH